MNVAPALLVGLLGSTHCIGMCGGLVAASRVSPARRYLVRTERAPWQLGLVQNGARILSYAALGCVAGTLGSALDGVWSGYGRFVLQTLALIVLLLTAASMLAVLPARFSPERVGAQVWARLAPRARGLLPLRTLRDAALFGLLWGLLPCGMVYSAIALAAASGGPVHGAATMLAFGLGTSPALLGVGLVAHRLAASTRWPKVAGLALLAFAVLQVSTLVRTGRDPHVCCTSSAAASWAHEAP